MITKLNKPGLVNIVANALSHYLIVEEESHEPYTLPVKGNGRTTFRLITLIPYLLNNLQ